MTRPLTIKGNHDHFGYYKVGSYKTYSKVEAIELSAKNNTKLQWMFNNEVYEKFHWNIEPPGTLDFWYGERAKQIRHAYDYIVLMYSGGADSWNVLRAFVDNNIFVDEICHYITHEGTPLGEDAAQNEEVYKTSYPAAKKLIETNPVYRHTKHRVVDGGPALIKRMASMNFENYFYEEGNSFYGPWGTTFADLRNVEPDFKRLAEKKKTVCFVWGYEKPLIEVKENGTKFFIKFNETSLSTFMKPKHQSASNHWQYDEAFYWTPDMPEISCLQGHIIKRFLEKVDDSLIDGYYLKYQEPNAKQGVGYSVKFSKNGKNYELTDHGAHRLIYKGWDTTTIVCPKTPSTTFSNKDMWWLKNNVQGSGNRQYVQGMFHLRDRIKKIAPEWWYDTKYDPTKELYRGGIYPYNILYALN